jgi:speckle-type POZ protein
MGTDIAGLLAADGGGVVGADVSFSVGGETVPAHRAVLAARSPVFRAELFGPMSDATSPSIALQDVDPAAFRLMVRYIYTDALPGDAELGDFPTETVRHLLAAADRYALDRLKLMCAQKLWEKVTADTIASTLAFAETYNCPELKSRCIDFFAVDRNLKQVIFTDGFRWLMQEFPSSLVAELNTRVGM